jgi:hypothetical protein
MANEIIDWDAPSLQGGYPRRPEDLPHGLLRPPAKVLEMIEGERPKHQPKAFAGAEMQLTNEWTLQYYFEYLDHEVLYRSTGEGPEVLAVGDEEISALTDGRRLEKMTGLKTWSPW